MTNQFRVLLKVFVNRIVEFESLSTTADTTKLLGQFAALLTGVSFLFTAPLIILSGLPQPVIWIVEHFFIATTMVVVGLVSIISWDSFLPDKRDLLILSPLPVPAQKLFWAKLCALIVTVVLSLVALNVFSGLIWPFFFVPHNATAMQELRSFLSYWMTLALASIFMFLCVMSIQAICVELLPRQMFLRASAVVQVAGVTLIIATFILEPTVGSQGARDSGSLTWIPTYWFWGLYEKMKGASEVAYVGLAKRAWLGLAISALISVCLMTVAYFRTLSKIIEEPDIKPGRSGFVQLVASLGTPLQFAITSFASLTILRSRQHRLILSVYLGVGLAIVFAYAKLANAANTHLHNAIQYPPPPAYLSCGLMMMCFAILGVRMIIAMPIALKANWVFQLTQIRPPVTYISTVRRMLALTTVTPACIASAVIYTIFFPSRFTAVHIVVLFLVGSMLADASLLAFRKIPFACSYLPGKANVHFVFWGIVFFGLPLMNAIGKIEYYCLLNYWGSALMLAVLLASSLAIRQVVLHNAAKTADLVFEEDGASEMVSLQIS